MAKSKKGSLSELLQREWKAVSYIFLGVGLTLFLLNISALLGLTIANGAIDYNYIGFDVSIFSSILLIVYIVYTLHEKK